MNLAHARKLACCCTVAALGGACATSATGRKQLQLLSAADAAQMGTQAFDQMKAEQKIEDDPQVNSYVRCVASTVAKQVKDGPKQWEVVVFQEPSANAFALPGGKIGVHTGLLQVAKTPAQLAAVLGHEVAHVTQGHGNERVSQSMVAQGGIVAIGAALGEKTGESHDLVMAALGLGAQFGVLMPFGRKQESEADIVGLQYMAKAGFDPKASVELWKNMAAATGGGPPEFLSTHPSHETRISQLEAEMDEAASLFEAATRDGNVPACKVDF